MTSDFEGVAHDYQVTSKDTEPVMCESYGPSLAKLEESSKHNSKWEHPRHADDVEAAFGCLESKTLEVAEEMGPFTRTGWIERLHFGLALLWAVFVGASVSFRLYCSVRLSKATGADSLWASGFVLAVSHVVSCAFLAPFGARLTMPRRLGPWLAGCCMLPTFPFVAAAAELGLGLTQMILRLATLATALVMDCHLNQLTGGMKARFWGTLVVIIGVAITICTGAGLGGVTSSAFVTMTAILGIFVTGVCYVLQAKLIEQPEQDQPDTYTDALVCQLTTASIIAPILIACSFAGGVSFHIHADDVPLWLCVGLQGAFYLRSLQSLPAWLGYSTTFSASLWGQLTAGVALEIATNGAGDFSLGQLLGLCLVLLGATVSAATGPSEQRKQASPPLLRPAE